MAYARFSPDSDVYVFGIGERLICSACLLTGGDYRTSDPEQMIAHLGQHIRSGHAVPEKAVQRLLREWLASASCDPSERHPCVLYRPGYDDPAEADDIRRFFPHVPLRSQVPRNSLVVGRYSVLPFYDELALDLDARGCRLINSPAQHHYLADIGNWYRDLQGMTPETWTELAAVPDEAFPCVLKGQTNSKKWHWTTHMFAETPSDAARIEETLRRDGLLCDQRVYFRRYVPLDHVCDSVLTDGPPVSREFRFFVCDGKVLSGGFYWSGCLDEGVRAPDPKDVPLQLLGRAIEVVGANARFYTLDVARTAAGDWIVIELNDGQMSGLSDNDPAVLYRNLKEVLT